MKILSNPIEVADFVIKNDFQIIVLPPMGENYHLGVYFIDEKGDISYIQVYNIPSKENFIILTDYLTEHNYPNIEEHKHAFEKYENDSLTEKKIFRPDALVNLYSKYTTTPL